MSTSDMLLCTWQYSFLRFTLSFVGIILKMARLTKAGSSRGQKNISDSVNKPPSKTLIIPARELVQIIAKVLVLLCLTLFQLWNLLGIG